MLCTRPDLFYTVGLLSRGQSKSNKELWVILKRVLRYIEGTLDYKLIYLYQKCKCKSSYWLC